MKWIKVEKRVPQKDENCWYYFELLGMFRGQYGGVLVDEHGKEMPGYHIFYNDEGFLTDDVTHWHPDQEEKPDYPIIKTVH